MSLANLAKSYSSQLAMLCCYTETAKMCILSGSVCLCYLTPFLPGVSRAAVNGNCLIHSATALRKHREPLAIFPSANFYFHLPPSRTTLFPKKQSPPHSWGFAQQY